MTIINTRCDICGKDWKDDRSEFEFKLWFERYNNDKTLHCFNIQHVCDECKRKLEDYLISIMDETMKNIFKEKVYVLKE